MELLHLFVPFVCSLIRRSIFHESLSVCKNYIIAFLLCISYNVMAVIINLISSLFFILVKRTGIILVNQNMAKIAWQCPINNTLSNYNTDDNLPIMIKESISQFGLINASRTMAKT